VARSLFRREKTHLTYVGPLQPRARKQLETLIDRALA
jgi:hypothetical protein